MEAMKPRNTKGRSWADGPNASVPDIPVPSTSSVRHGDAPVPDPASKAKKTKNPAAAEPSAPEVPPDDNDDSISDLEWMRRRMAASVLDSSASRPDDEVIAEAPGNGIADDTSPAASKDPGVTDAETVEELLRESPRLYLRNLPYSCTVADLEEAFSPFGQVVQVIITFSFSPLTSLG